MKKKRSIGVLVSAIIVFIMSIYHLCSGIILFALLEEMVGVEVTLGGRISASWYYFVIALPLIISGIGLLKLKRWAPIVTVLAYIVQIQQFLPFCLYDFSDIFPFSIYIIVLVFLIWFFTRPKVKEQFR